MLNMDQLQEQQQQRQQQQQQQYIDQERQKAMKWMEKQQAIKGTTSGSHSFEIPINSPEIDTEHVVVSWEQQPQQQSPFQLQQQYIQQPQPQPQLQQQEPYSYPMQQQPATTTGGTIFEQILAGQSPCNPVYQDKDCAAIFDAKPAAPVHVVIFPRVSSGLDHLSCANQSHEQLLGHLILVAKDLAQQLGVGQGYRLVINDGYQGHQTV